MATHGWQNEKFIHTVNNWLAYYANVSIDGISHTGSSLRVWGTIALCCRNGTSGGGGTQTVNNGISASVNGSGGKVKKSGETAAYTSTFRQGTDCYVGFDTTYYNVSASTTSIELYAHFASCENASCSSVYWTADPHWTIYFDSSGTNPSDLSIVYNSSTWNSVNATASLQHWGGVSGSRLEAIMVTGSSEADFNTITSSNWTNHGRLVWQKNTTAYSETFNMTPSNIALQIDSPMPILGMRKYYLAEWAVNSVSLSAGLLDTTVRYLPPAPGQLSYSDPGGAGTKVVPVEYTGVVANNNANYDQSELTRSVRYKIDDGQWVWVTQAVTAFDAVTSFDVSVAPGSYATVEAWMNYHGMSSEVSTVTIPNNNNPFFIYGSVGGESVATIKWYGSVNDESKKIIKIYGSHEGVARKLFEDV